MSGLTDTQRFWLECKRAGTRGLHSWECYGWTRNAPQRAKDCVDKGQPIHVRAERREGRPGARYWLAEFAPSDATPVRPNNFDGTPSLPVVAQEAQRAAGVTHGVGGPRLLVRDYTIPDGVWELRAA